MAKILCEITDEDLETGLRGVPVGYCVTSRVDPTEGLFYHDKPVKELAGESPETVLSYLIQGRMDTGSILEGFCADLHKKAYLAEEVKQAVFSLPRSMTPMQMFNAALLIAGGLHAKREYREDCVGLIAKMPELLALVINHHAGWGDTPVSDPSLGYIENFVSMLNIPDKENFPLLVDVFRIFYVLHLDHGGGNLSAFTGKVVASGLADMYLSICASMCALAGPRHGLANQNALEFVKEVYAAVGDAGTREDIETFVKNTLAKKGLIFGFGHAVLRVEDPRATLFYDYARTHFVTHPLVNIALQLRDAAAKVLKENPKITNPYPNIDAISGTLLAAAGFPYSEYYTMLFGLARSAGVAIQIVYERVIARGGKGTPIVRPKYIYKPKGSC